MQRFGRFLALAAVGLTVMLTVVDVAEARRSSSGFGSRGTRTFQTPAITRTAPNTATPIDRTMTQPGANQATGQQGLGQAARPGTQGRGLFGGFAGSMLGGLALGGLIGMMMGTGFGGGIGFLGLLLQMALIAGAVMLAMRFSAAAGRRRQPVMRRERPPGAPVDRPRRFQVSARVLARKPTARPPAPASAFRASVAATVPCPCRRQVPRRTKSALVRRISTCSRRS